MEIIPELPEDQSLLQDNPSSSEDKNTLPVVPIPETSETDPTDVGYHISDDEEFISTFERPFQRRGAIRRTTPIQKSPIIPLPSSSTVNMTEVGTQTNGIENVEIEDEMRDEHSLNSSRKGDDDDDRPHGDCPHEKSNTSENTFSFKSGRPPSSSAFKKASDITRLIRHDFNGKPEELQLFLDDGNYS